MSELIRHDTVNRVVSRTEKECQTVLHVKLQELGFAVELYNTEEVPGFHEHPSYYSGKDYRDSPNVYATEGGNPSFSPVILRRLP